jgi:hypothetical protein
MPYLYFFYTHLDRMAYVNPPRFSASAVSLRLWVSGNIRIVERPGHDVVECRHAIKRLGGPS